MTALVPMFPAGVVPTATGLLFTRMLTWDEWIGLGLQLRDREHTLKEQYTQLQWYGGDWLTYGETQFGEQFSQAEAETGFAVRTLMNWRWVAKNVAPSRRRESLSFSHHAEVARLEPAEQDRLLTEAEERRLPRAEFRELVKTYRAELQPVEQPRWSPAPCPKAETCPHVQEWRERVEEARG